MERNLAISSHHGFEAKQDGRPRRSPMAWDSDPLPGFPFKIAEEREPAQQVMIYQSVDLSIELHIRVSFSEFDLGEEIQCWSPFKESKNSSQVTQENIDLEIYSYRNYIVTVLQKASLPDPDITRMAAISMIERISDTYKSFI